jgi:hypothetical protein
MQHESNPRQQPRQVFTPANRFDYDRSKIPPDMEYQWKRVTIAGKEDPENMILCEQNGWTPVPNERHPELVGARAPAGEAIVRGGQMLMQLPKQYVDEAVADEKFTAHHTVEEQIQRLGIQARQNGAKGIKRERRVAVEGEVVE